MPMLKLTVALMTLALAGTASAAEWRSLRIDASSEAAFNESIELFRDRAPPPRVYAFERSLQEVFMQGAAKAAADEREYTQSDYYAQLDGLDYDDVVTLADPTGEQEKEFRVEFYSVFRPDRSTWSSPIQSTPPARIGFQGQQVRGGDSYRNPYL
jgi:hypothetical protein